MFCCVSIRIKHLKVRMEKSQKSFLSGSDFFFYYLDVRFLTVSIGNLLPIACGNCGVLIKINSAIKHESSH